MEPLVEVLFLEESFWYLYTLLWQKSLYKSVFQSPHFIQQLAEKFKGRSTVYQYFSDGELKGVCFLRNDQGVHHFLSDLKSDHNFFVLSEDCTPSEKDAFFKGFFEKIREKQMSLLLINQPEWASYQEVFTKEGNHSNLYLKSSNYSVCPILEESTPLALAESLNKNTEPKRKATQLLKKGAVLEIYQEQEDLEQWVDDFIRLHIQRWASTHTPSRYVDPDQKVFLLHCLRAWIEDQVAVRFSLRLGEERIALWICLVQGNRLIRHTTTYDIHQNKLSPGKAMIYHVSQWMLENNLSILDFGEGAEAYKYEFTNKDLNLQQILVSSRKNVPFIIKANLKQAIHEWMKKHPKVKAFYYDKIWPLLH